MGNAASSGEERRLKKDGDDDSDPGILTVIRHGQREGGDCHGSAEQGRSVRAEPRVSRGL